ncbi:ABC transporter ATPase [Flavobacterium sp. F-328]|jgi:chemotaxis regulatin CheY-phosphate phosphatase CheZ|uniref:ABC transporter ATPase n=1 Tax=Flavobacterium erciyesense TaxID=2825842 RepID=A0ABS5D1V5_9FLAO|nr:ABC transporter ATPase [Flavobacterium erciyesense]MBQ0907999.1 ABC transporter ATPase [Flavobacterium erciyesense]
MYVPFENLPEESRIWIYQSNRKFSDAEFAEIETAVQSFLNEWAAHGTSLEASYQLKYNRFIILAVNQDVQMATGCSIDASVEFIQSLEKKYSVDLLDKMNVTFKLGEHIAHKPLLDFKKMVKDKAVTENTIVFNNLVNNVQEFNESWEVAAVDSWHSRFF